MTLAGPFSFVLAQDPPIDAELIKKAQAIHERVIILDSHVDIAVANFTGERNYTERLDNQFNLPKMFDGGVSAVFLVVYVGQTTEARDPDAFKRSGYERAYGAAIEKFEAIHRLTKELAPDKIELALTSDDVRRIKAKGKKAALIGVENGYPIGEEIGRVKEFFDRGGRYLSLSHNGHSQLSDSNTGERDGWKWNGLSPLGKQVIAEMNKVGLMIDVSHPSKASMMQTLELSKAPIIASHSAVRALCDVSRNMDDEQLLALKKAAGSCKWSLIADLSRCRSRTHRKEWRPSPRSEGSSICPSRRHADNAVTCAWPWRSSPPNVGKNSKTSWPSLTRNIRVTHRRR